jgi:hypothetical protein
MAAAGPDHECRQGRRCKSRIRDAEEKWHGAGVEDAGRLCRLCEEHSFADIRQLKDDYALLVPARTEAVAHVSGPKVSGSGERPIPIRLGPDSLMAELDVETLRWARRITRGAPIPNDDCYTVLCSNLGTLIDLPSQLITAWLPLPDGGDDFTRLVLDGVDAVLRLSRLHQRAQSMLGLTEVTAWLTESCHVCGLRTLTTDMRNGVEDTLINCRNCRNVWHQADFARLNNPLLVA